MVYGERLNEGNTISMHIPKVTPEIITAAIEGFESQKKRLDIQIGELRQMLNGSRPDPSAEATRPKRRKMSASARARIAEAQRKRWAESKKESAPVQTEAVAGKRRRLSEAGKRRIIAATKARWTRIRAEKAQALAARKSGKKVTAKSSKKGRGALTAVAEAAGQGA